VCDGTLMDPREDDQNPTCQAGSSDLTVAKLQSKKIGFVSSEDARYQIPGPLGGTSSKGKVPLMQRARQTLMLVPECSSRNARSAVFVFPSTLEKGNKRYRRKKRYKNK